MYICVQVSIYIKPKMKNEWHEIKMRTHVLMVTLMAMILTRVWAVCVKNITLIHNGEAIQSRYYYH
jgi:hypothetical protein